MFPGTLTHCRDRKRAKLLKYAERVWGLVKSDENTRIRVAIEKTDEFFRGLGVGTRLADYGVLGDACQIVAERFTRRTKPLSEHGDLKARDVEAILTLRA